MSLTFGLLAGILSLGLSILAWVVVSSNLVSEAKAHAVTEAVLDRDAVQAAVVHGPEAVSKALPLKVRSGKSALALVGGHWLSGAPGFGPEQLPADLRQSRAPIEGVVQRTTVADAPYLVVALSLQPAGNAYFEWVPEGALGPMLQRLAIGLAASAVVMTAVGLLLGRSATGLALRPLASLGSVAGRVARGDLSARLPTDDDPDLREIATSFNATIDELQRRVAMESRFAVDVSHELRTPLTTMLNSVEVIRNRRDNLPPEVREPLDMLTADVQRFRSLVVDLLEFSRDDAGDRLVLEDVVLSDLVRHAADAAAGRPVTVVDLAAEDIVMAVEKRRMERVVANLVGNAETHGSGCTEVRVTRSDGVARILVDDDGPGVPPSERRRVFDRFARGDGGGRAAGSPDGVTGSGIGLAIVERHVTLHGGKVSVAPSPAGGARFIVDLPIGSPASTRRARGGDGADGQAPPEQA
ncbi:MAG TPA: HAMP domain-containing sensor histidine kinase [Intrasporangium sp.]|nr:HAMP domain-containing sensor histidine kinase [Intrasporangium sp.]